ncbi:hypothetical protein J2Y67_004133 [Neobacillus niacini]|nr:hypothetical protein [Neobacillus niacini]
MLELMIMCAIIYLSTFLCLKQAEEEYKVIPFENFEDFF